jgi:signal transduction histidine kinase
VALAVNLQHAITLLVADPAAAKTLLDEMGCDVRRALDETARLSERIHAPLLERDGRLAPALRSAAVSAGVAAAVEVSPAVSTCPPEIARTVLLCWNEALDADAGAARPTVTVGEEDNAVVFEIVSGAALGGLRDRVDALGGRLTVEPLPSGESRASGWLPLSRRP